jgi:hypothetical protein
MSVPNHLREPSSSISSTNIQPSKLTQKTPSAGGKKARNGTTAKDSGGDGVLAAVKNATKVP